MVEIYDKANTILSSCRDINAVITVIDEMGDQTDETITGACIATVRNALTAIVDEIRDAAGIIVELANDSMSP